MSTPSSSLTMPKGAIMTVLSHISAMMALHSCTVSTLLLIIMFDSGGDYCPVTECSVSVSRPGVSTAQLARAAPARPGPGSL